MPVPQGYSRSRGPRNVPCHNVPGGGSGGRCPSSTSVTRTSRWTVRVPAWRTPPRGTGWALFLGRISIFGRRALCSPNSPPRPWKLRRVQCDVATHSAGRSGGHRASGHPPRPPERNGLSGNACLLKMDWDVCVEVQTRSFHVHMGSVCLTSTREF